MKLPKFEDLEFSPLAWKEWLLDPEEFGSKWSIYNKIANWNKEGYLESCLEIKNYVRNKRIRKLLYGYALLDLLDWSGMLQYVRIKMWRLFEDTVAEIFQEAIKARREYTITRVDNWPGFRGLDFIIVNSKRRAGWKVGIQCKRYIGTHRSYNKISECSSWTRGTSAAWLRKKGVDAKRRFPGKKIILIAFNCFRKKKLQERRFKKLQEVWDLVTILDDNRIGELPYTYRLQFDDLEKIVNWC